MRRIFTLIGCCITVVGFSQLQVGTRLLSGQFNLDHGNTIQEGSGIYNKSRATWSRLELGLQKLYKPNRIRGVGVGFVHSNQQVTRATGVGTDRETERTIIRGMSVQYFEQVLFPFGTKWYGTITMGGRAEYSFEHQKGERGSSNKYDNYQFIMGVAPGVAYHFHKRWLADFSLGQLAALNVVHRKWHNNNVDDLRYQRTNVYLSSLLTGLTSFSVGFRYILR
ncbi:MAG: hypothetical protein MUF62_07100 [Chitinophagaceae bacterium]|jgi:hypothetical protein|nr:hypothetical protein [Chitinophagaceae bacterium]